MIRFIHLIVFIFILIYFQNFSAFSQDIIYKKDGEEIKARVLESGKNKNYVLYKEFDDPDFVTRTIATDKLRKIRFENGSVKNFSEKLSPFIGMSVGPSKPSSMGKNYDASSGGYGYLSDDHKIGYMEKGGHLELNFGYYFLKRLGFVVNLGGIANSMELTLLEDDLRRHSNNDIVVHRNNEEGSHYISRYLMVGPLYSIKLSERFLIDLSLAGGPFNVTRRGFTISSSYPDSFNIRYEKMKGHTMAIKSALGIRVKVVEHIYLRASFDNYFANYQLEGMANISDYHGNRTEENIMVYNLNIRNFSFGLTYTFK